MTDCKNSHLFGFSAAAGVHRKLAEFEKSEVPVRLSKCEVKPSRQGGQLEIQVGKDTEVQKSEKSFEVKSLKEKIEGGKTIFLEELPQLMQFQHVTVLVKVIYVDEPNEVPGGKMKQDVQVGDSTGTVQVTFWETEIGKVNVGKSY